MIDDGMRCKIAIVIANVLNGYTLAQGIQESEITTFQFYNALDQDPELKQKYELAQEYRAEVIVDEIIHIADTEPDPAVAKVRIEARKWVAGKHKSKKYGDKVDINVNHTVDLLGAITEAQARIVNITPQVSVSEGIDTPDSGDAIDLSSDHNLNLDFPSK